MAEGRAALITGGSSGIGLAIARALGQEGYGLTVSARRPEKLEDLPHPFDEFNLRKTGIDPRRGQVVIQLVDPRP